MNERRSHAAAAVINKKIYCCGGYNGRYLSSAECYDPHSDVWTQVCDMPQPSAGHAAVPVDGNLIVIGGQTGVEKYLSSMWVLDTKNKNGEWSDKPFMSHWRRNFGVAKMNNDILVCGGEFFYKTLDDVEMFDGKLWTNGPKLINPLWNVATTVIPMNFAKHLK